MTRVRVKPRPFDQVRRKNDAFTHSATLPMSGDFFALETWTVKVVNDAAERGVKPNIGCAAIITDDVQQKHDLLQAIEAH